MDASASPTKRHKTTSSAAGGAASVAQVLAAEPALLLLIARFTPQDAEQVGSSKCQVVLKTVASLCGAFPTLGRLVGPTNESFWREMVLSHFDFSEAEESFNIENVNEIGAALIPDAFHYGEENTKPEEWQEWCRNPAKEPLDAWAAANPDVSTPEMFFEEDYGHWRAIGAYSRPSQYGFLAKIQADRSLMESLWPQDEHAFSLFCDVVVLQKLVRPAWSGFETYSDGEQFLTPCLLSRLDCEDLTEANDYKMLKNCSFLPHFWNCGVRSGWTGFAGSVPPVEVRAITKEMEWEPERAEYATKDELGLFPLSGAQEFVNLRRLAYESFNDWRRVHVNYGEETGPEFYIGRSKMSGRWIGLMGQSDYLSYS